MAEEDVDMYAMMGIPMAFGKQAKKKVDVTARFDKTKRMDAPAAAATSALVKDGDDDGVLASGAQRKKDGEQAQDGEDEEEDEGDDDDGDVDAEDGLADEHSFPISHEIKLKDHTKVVSALALDSSGARILSGSHDYDCKLWDFGGMGSSYKPFKTWEPAGSYHVHDMKYAPGGDQFLVISGTMQPKLYDREGADLGAFIKGDPYIRDMRHTAGHVGEINTCAWNPKQPDEFITGSNDSTIRIWNVEDRRKQKTVIVIKSKERGTRTRVTACGYSADGKLVAGACIDGTLNVWSTTSNFVRPSQSVEGAHVKGTQTGSVVFSVDGRTILTRGGDDTVKLWDSRNLRKALHVSPTPLKVLYSETNAIFSPDEKYIVTGCAASSKSTRGKLAFLKREGLEEVKSIDCAEGESVVRVVWHSKINQIVTGLSTGSINVLYSPSMSQNGAKLLLSRMAKKVTIEDASRALMEAPIITPHALPMFRDEERGSNKRKRDKDRMDTRKTKRPMPPVSGPGRGGRVGASATQHVVQSLVRDTTRDEDPREALLKYAEVGEADPQWTAAWKVNQPKPVFAEVEEEEEEAEN